MASGSDEDPSAKSARTRRSLRRALFALIALLYVASVPWYRDTGAPLRVVLGLPDWVAIALLCYLGVAAANCAAWLLTDVDDRDGGEAASEVRSGEASAE